MDKLRILLVDDHTLFRQGLQSLITTRDDYEVVGSARDGLEAIDQARKMLPDVILMDIEMPHSNGLEATRVIKREMPHVKIVILTVMEDENIVFEALKSGAQGYLLKDLEAYQLFDMLDNLRQGGAPLSGRIAAKVLSELSHPESVPAAPKIGEELSAREKEVLQLLAEGKSNKEIAVGLSVSENTIKTHLANIMSKLHLQNRIQTAVYAVREGLVDKAG